MIKLPTLAITFHPTVGALTLVSLPNRFSGFSGPINDLVFNQTSLVPISSLVLHPVFNNIFTAKSAFALGCGIVMGRLRWLAMGLHPLFNMT